jgi:hypothetical protein
LINSNDQVREGCASWRRVEKVCHTKMDQKVEEDSRETVRGREDEIMGNESEYH